MDKKEASATIRKMIKELGIKAKYSVKTSLSFDFVADISGDDGDLEKVRFAVKKLNLVYSDPANDIMSDYWGGS